MNTKAFIFVASLIKFPLILSFDFSFCLNIKSWNWLDRTNAEEDILEHKLSICILVKDQR